MGKKQEGQLARTNTCPAREGQVAEDLGGRPGRLNFWPLTGEERRKRERGCENVFSPRAKKRKDRLRSVTRMGGHAQDQVIHFSGFTPEGGVREKFAVFLENRKGEGETEGTRAKREHGGAPTFLGCDIRQHAEKGRRGKKKLPSMRSQLSQGKEKDSHNCRKFSP